MCLSDTRPLVNAIETSEIKSEVLLTAVQFIRIVTAVIVPVADRASRDAAARVDTLQLTAATHCTHHHTIGGARLLYTAVNNTRRRHNMSQSLEKRLNAGVVARNIAIYFLTQFDY